MIIAGLIFLLLLIAGWIAGEVKNSRPLRITCITIFILASSTLTIAASLSGMFGSMNTSLAITEANQKWMQSTAAALRADKFDSIRAEVDTLAAWSSTYESVSYIRALEESVKRLDQP